MELSEHIQKFNDAIGTVFEQIDQLSNDNHITKKDANTIKQIFIRIRKAILEKTIFYHVKN